MTISCAPQRVTAFVSLRVLQHEGVFEERINRIQKQHLIYYKYTG